MGMPAVSPVMLAGSARTNQTVLLLRAPSYGFLPPPPNCRKRCWASQPRRSVEWWCPQLKSRKCNAAAAPTESAATDASDDVFVVPRPQTAQELQWAFGRPGLRFLEMAAGVPAAELKLRNGTRARVLLPRAQIISYQPHMWHGGEEEWLYTSSAASSSRSGSGPRDGGAKFSADSTVGGIELRFGDGQQVGSLNSQPVLGAERWTVEGVYCNPGKYAQITLTCSSIRPAETVSRSEPGKLQGRYVVTLTEHYLSSALMLVNTGLPQVDFTCSIATHLAVRTMEGTVAVGLKGQRLYSRTDFPAPQERPSSFPAAFGKIVSRALGGFVGSAGDSGPSSPDSERRADDDGKFPLDNGGRNWGVECDDYSDLRGGDDRVYPSSPDSFTFLDRGLRRSLRIEKIGFREIFVSNPGPESNLANWDNFVCLGPAEMTGSVRLAENERWQGAQVLWNIGSD